MKAEILSVGTELLLGQLTDTNAPYLAQSLSEMGIDLFWISQVGDNHGRMVDALRRGWERSDVIVISGGLGPTEDDLTREGISELLGETMEVQPGLEADLRAFFASRSRAMPERNLKQATLIPSSRAIPNPIGTAPGWWVERDSRIIVAMPGVPVEMKRMWTEEVVPRLSRIAGGGVILSRTLKTIGIGESWVEEELKELIPSTNPTVATYAKQDGVHVRVTAKADDAAGAREMVAGMEARIRAILKDHVYGVDEETIPDSVAGLLHRKGMTLATLESGTAGQLLWTLASGTSAGEAILGGAMAEGEPLLRSYGVDGPQAADATVLAEETAMAMAVAARTQSGASIGLGLVCGMETGSGSGQHMGVVHCAVADVEGVVGLTNRYSTTLKDVRRRAVLDAVDLLRKRLLAN